MSENWVGKSVSIQCRGNIGVFQGVIKQVSPVEIVITKAVRNGIPLKKTSVEVTLTCKDIEKLNLISSTNLPNLFPAKVQQNNQLEDSVLTEIDNLKLTNPNGQQTVRIKTPPSEGRSFNGKLTAKSPGPSRYATNGQQKNGYENGSAKSTSRPIDINGGGSQKVNSITPHKNENQKKKSRSGNGNGNNGSYRFTNKNSAFGTPVDDPMMDQDFDFEKNLALFNKQAIFDEIDAIQQRPDLLRQTVASGKKKYRHDENVLASEPIQYRQIEVENSGATGSDSDEYVTDEGLVIPSIPRNTRNLVQQLAENHGLTTERQNDLLARGATELALQLLGGSRRLTPNNQHQWPKIVVVCDEPYNARLSEIGIATGRMLACHGLKVFVYVSCATKSTRTSHELELFAATGNLFTFNINTLPSSDLVIAAIKSRNLGDPLRNWLAESRAPVLAIDPPVGGLEATPVKCSILPVLPLNGLGPETSTGRLYLCNLGIPDKFFADSGIKYKSPFDKAVIPIHRRKD
ncbi:enhancer of mRNA-decapping protein 3 [Topomyia yanbarensis]|uniref:enhancer of mRNA-decapping protein 3 n=1 Tax=Topomyia yanbarensis TaxID=2498891 RepID=UPI00273CB36C|nr:enhancer of mRNA-decapping protein 3 [Topomyia yanbarensis]